MKRCSIGLTEPEFNKLSGLAKTYGLSEEQLMKQVLVTVLMLNEPTGFPPFLESTERLGDEPV